MVNNSTNFNKANNHISLQLIEHRKFHNAGNPGPDLRQAQKCGGVKTVNFQIVKFHTIDRFIYRN
jgi:hypothetical protein